MKRLLLAMLALGMVLSLSACDAEVSSTGSTGGESATGKEAEPAADVKTEYKVGEGIKVDDAVMTVVSGKKWKPKNEFDTPDDGKVFYIVNIKIQNNGDSPLDYNEYNYKIEDANGVQTDAAFVTDVPNQMSSGSLAPGGKLDSNIVFQAPKDMKSLKLIMEPNFFSEQQVRIILTK